MPQGNRFGEDTVRLTILRAFKAAYEASTDQDPPPSGKKYYGVKFSRVEIGPLGEPDQSKRSAIGIVASRESKQALYPLREVQFEVHVEFRFTVNKGDEDPGIMVESMLGVVQQIIYDDDTLGGIAIKTDEHGNEADLQTYADKTVQGVVKFRVLYRHAFNDVFDPTPTA